MAIKMSVMIEELRKREVMEEEEMIQKALHISESDIYKHQQHDLFP
jgi:hypothetical protein